MKTKFIDTLVQNTFHPFQVITLNMSKSFNKKDSLRLEIELGATYAMYCEEENELFKTVLEVKMKNIRKLLRALKYGEDSYITKTAQF